MIWAGFELLLDHKHECGIDQHYYVLNVEAVDHARRPVVRTLVIVPEPRNVMKVVVLADEVEDLYAYVASLLLHSHH